MEIYGLQKLTLLDYPGKTACTLFTSGCNFRCPFCHNSSLVFNRVEPLDSGEIFSFLKKRAGILDGVCITGGEPLLNADIAEFIKEIKTLGYKVKLDTNGSFPDRLSSLINEGLIDYVAMDIKSSKEGYQKAVGIENYNTQNVERSVELLLSDKVPYEFRTTAVKGIHTKEDFEKIAKWISGAKQYYIQNYRESDDILCSDNLSPFDENELKMFKKRLENAVCKVILRGIE